MKDYYFDSEPLEKIDKGISLLEYKEEKGHWHYNTKPYNVDEYGWESIAYTSEWKAKMFTWLVDCINDQRRRDGEPFLSTEKVKRLWMLYVIAVMWHGLEYATVDRKKLTELVNFNLARCGNDRFVSEETFAAIERQGFWNYDPLSFDDSNLV